MTALDHPALRPEQRQSMLDAQKTRLVTTGHGNRNFCLALISNDNLCQAYATHRGLTNGSALVIETNSAGGAVISTSSVNHVNGKYYRVSVGMDRAAIITLAQVFAQLAAGDVESMAEGIEQPSTPPPVVGLRIAPTSTTTSATTKPGRLVYALDDRGTVAIVHIARCEHAAELIACDAGVLVHSARSTNQPVAFCTECVPMGEDNHILNRAFDNVVPARTVGSDAWSLFQTIAIRRESELSVRDVAVGQ